MEFIPRLIAWELTKRCNLKCIHCRAFSPETESQELSKEEIFRILKEIKKVGKPIIILTGGEPLLREDIYEIIGRVLQEGLRPVLASNGTFITREVARKLKKAGIQRVSISLDGSSPEVHDGFRKVPGAFEKALQGIENLKEEGIPFQINTTITRSTVEDLPKIYELALKLGAVAHHIFIFVPVGKGKKHQEEGLSPEEYEKILEWFYERKKEKKIELKATCAPQYYRIMRQKAKKEGIKIEFKTFGFDAMTRGCLAGTGFCFVSAEGIVQPCGYLEVNCGDLKKDPFDKIWKESPIFNALRDFSQYKGKCGKCEYIRVCGGCRARAYEATGDFLEEEPLCPYIPASISGKTFSKT